MIARILVVVPILFLLLPGRSQSTCMEFHALTDGSGGSLRAFAEDPDGAVYFTGWFADSITFGGQVITGTDHNEFVAKLDAGGALAWYHVFCTDMFSLSTGAVLDGAGGLLLTGDFTDQLSFGTCTYYHPGSSDIFVARLHADDGSCDWVATGSSIGYAHARDITVAADGTIRVTGGFWGYCTFGSTTLNCTGTMSPFVAAYAANGTALWAKQVVDGTGGESEGVSTDEAGNTFIAGSHGSAANLGNGVTLPTAGYFVAKYDAAGTALWARPAPIGTGSYKRVVSGDNGAVYVLASSPSAVLKYTATGDTVWTRSWTGYSPALAFRDGHVRVAAMYQSALTIGTETITSTNTFGKVALIDLDDNGEVVELRGFENNGLSNIAPTTITTDAQGVPVVAGDYTCMHANVADTILGLPYRNGCYVLRACMNIGIPPTADPALRAVLFPNPANTSVTMEYAFPPGNAQATCRLFDAQGRAVRTATLPDAAGRVVLDLGSLPPGYYTCRIDTAHNAGRAQRLVIVR